MIVADTGAVLALLDAAHPRHADLLHLWQQDPAAWLLPSPILPEIDYLARRILGARVARLFLDDVVSGAFAIEFADRDIVRRAAALDAQHADLEAGFVDCAVAAVGERINAAAIATLDERHFAVLAGGTPLYPRDL
jgi:uncharacterized protein